VEEIIKIKSPMMFSPGFYFYLNKDLNHADAAELAALTAALRGLPLRPEPEEAAFLAVDFLAEPAGLPRLPVFFATVAVAFAAPGLRPRFFPGFGPLLAPVVFTAAFFVPALRPRFFPGFGPRLAPGLFAAAALAPAFGPLFLPGLRPRFAPAEVEPPVEELCNLAITHSTTLF
jgi:hypothetical protein